MMAMMGMVSMMMVVMTTLASIIATACRDYQLLTRVFGESRQ
jgi:hypothetical protein